jgi:hypothetical protein
MKQINIITLLSIITIIVACTSKVNTSEISVTGADGTIYSSYQSACSKGDFDAARDYVGKLKEKNVEVQAEGDYEEKKAFEKLIQEAESYVANEEIQYLASLNEEQANNRIILILNQRPVEGLEAAERTCLGKDVSGFYIERHPDLCPEELQNFRKYIAWCGNHNSTCSTVLNIAIACGNQSLAKKILHCFRQDPELQQKETKGDDDHYDVYAHYTSTSKDAAQKKYDEAVKSGAFN